jgi:hypothetical protein
MFPALQELVEKLKGSSDPEDRKLAENYERALKAFAAAPGAWASVRKKTLRPQRRGGR